MKFQTIVKFAGFSAQALADRIIDANCQILVTADGTNRGNKCIKLKSISDEAIAICKQRYWYYTKLISDWVMLWLIFEETLVSYAV